MTAQYSYKEAPAAREAGVEQPPEILELTVTSAKLVAEGVRTITFASPGGNALPRWDPGAHIELHLAPDLRRQYSLCGDPNERRAWTVAVLHERNGRGGSAFVHERLLKGSRVTVSRPRNNFALVDAPNYLLIAGGIGVTPIIPMVQALREAGKPFAVVYGGRSLKSMAFRDRLNVSAMGRIVFWPQDQRGLIDLDAALSNVDRDTAVYCCGPGPLIDAVAARCDLLRPFGFYRERFTATAPAIDEDGDGFEVVLAQSGRTLSVGPDESMLDALDRAGVEVTSSCRAGICGTCVVNVLSGVPDHRDDLLNDEQRNAGEIMLPCVSRSYSKSITIDK